MGYGLCGQATAGLIARSIPIVIPRAHDCITLFLGSRDSYQYQFVNYPGTYWYADDYIERSDGQGGALSLGSGSVTGLDKTYEEYVAKYGVDNADYLMEVLGGWQKHYKRAAYIDLGVADGREVEDKAKVGGGAPRLGLRPSRRRHGADQAVWWTATGRMISWCFSPASM